MLDDAIKAEALRHKASLLPGCGPECGFGIHNLNKCRAFTTKKAAYSDPSDHISLSAGLDNSLNLLTSAGDQTNDIMNVDGA